MPNLSSFKTRAQGYQARGEVYEKQDLRSLSASGSSFEDCEFVDCKMQLAFFQFARLTNVRFSRCAMPLANFQGAILADVIFSDCDLEQASFVGASLRATSFVSARLAYSSFLNATFRGASGFTKSNLHGADLGILEADYGTPSFTDSNLWGAKVIMGCQLWNADLDEVTLRRVAALIARKTDDLGVRAYAGDQLAVVERLMKEKP